ncbi:MAG: DUF58 domain-containing protein [Burkholderiaceae bacterium]|jgi:uncharacterized protein (DUF58 family)|nr:DUF58 domain-containing protein [Burkholderiaceae bacterium]
MNPSLRSALFAAFPWLRWGARLRERVRAWWHGRLTLTDHVQLSRRNVYILPSRAGLLLAATLGVLLVASINYQLNLGYLLTFLLAGCAAVGMVVSHETLRGLAMHLMTPASMFAGQLAVLDVKLVNASARPRRAIGVALLDSQHWAWADVPAQGEARVQVSFKPPRRGLHHVPTLVAETQYPLGTFRVWTVWRPAAQVLVYPAPESNPPPLPPGEPRAGHGLAGMARAGGEFDGVRAWRRGDPLKLLVWKKFAKTGDLVSRDAQQAQRMELWLDFSRAGLAEAEARIARLTAWVLAADTQNLDWGLRLPGLEIAPDSGAAHRLRCLEALALA